MLALSGFDSIITRGAVRALLATTFILNMVGHFLCAAVCGTDATVWVLQPTDFTRANRRCSVGSHIVGAIVWLMLVIYILTTFKDHGNSSDDSNDANSRGAGDSYWSLTGPGVATFFVLVYWSVVMGTAAVIKQPLGMLRPPKSEGGRCGLLTLAVMVHLGA